MVEAVIPQVLRSAGGIWRIIELASCWLNYAIITPTITRPLHGFPVPLSSSLAIQSSLNQDTIESFCFLVFYLRQTTEGNMVARAHDFFCDITRRYAFPSSSRSFSSPLLHSWGRVWCGALRFVNKCHVWIIFQLSTPDSVSFVVPRSSRENARTPTRVRATN